MTSDLPASLTTDYISVFLNSILYQHLQSLAIYINYKYKYTLYNNKHFCPADYKNEDINCLNTVDSIFVNWFSIAI